jgi:hypothetical protein
MDEMEKHLKRIVGGTITNLVEYTDLEEMGFNEGMPDGLWGFKVKMPDGTIFETMILCDPEGNGPGFLEIANDGYIVGG